MSFSPNIGAMPGDALRALAPNGVLRAGLNLSNGLLVSTRDAEGRPAGVAPAMAAAIAAALGLALELVPYPNPGALADAAGRDEWDIALLGAEPQRAEVIAFTSAYADIEATYLVPQGSALHAVADVDRPGVTIAVGDRTAYGLWLERNVRAAELRRIPGVEASFTLFVEEKLDAFAGLRPRLVEDAAKLPGARVLPGRFMAVQQAVGTPRAKDAALPWLEAFVAAARRGFVAELIARYGVEGLSVAGA